MSLQKRNGRHNKSDVVNVSHDAAAIDTGGTRIDSEANGEEKRMVNLQRDSGGVLFRVQASERSSKVGGDRGGVSRGRDGEGGGGATECAGVVNGGGGGLVVD